MMKVSKVLRTQTHHLAVAVVALLAAGAAAACGGKTKPTESPATEGAAPTEPAAKSAERCTGGEIPPDIVGKYKDNFGGTHDITDKVWIMGGDGAGASTFDYCEVQNARSRLSAQNGAENQYYPDLFSAFYWTRTADEKLWFCQQVFNAETAQQAMDAPPPDSSDPSKSGCGEKSFPWSELIPVTE